MKEKNIFLLEIINIIVYMRKKMKKEEVIIIIITLIIVIVILEGMKLKLIVEVKM